MGSLPEHPKRTPLYAMHRALGARMVVFGGWEMPVQYTGINEEHRAVREVAGIFDVSHMGQIRVCGRAAEAFLDYLFPIDVTAVRPCRMAYTVMCNRAGGIVDDLALLRFDQDDFLLVVNAARTKIDFAWIVEHSCGFSGVHVEDRSVHMGMLALQGPHAESFVTRWGGIDLAALRYFDCKQRCVDGVEATICRSGYTGEDGFEIICSGKESAYLFERFHTEGLVPCGIGARDTLRTEMGYSLYGQDLDERTSPFEAGLSWLLDLERPTDFIGRDTLVRLKASGPSRRRIGFTMLEKSIPRTGYNLLSINGRNVGLVTSGTHSPMLGQAIGLGRVVATLDRREREITVEIRGRKRRAKVVRPPFVPSHVKNS